jgi:HlyD family secretion protein
MKKLIWLLIPALAAVAGWLAYRQRTAPPAVAFARVERNTLVSTLTTNGRVEPLEWSAVVAGRPGLVTALRAGKGAHVGRGDVLVELAPDDARADLAAAEARVAQVRAEIQLQEQGGRSSELAAIDAEARTARLDLEAARKEQTALARLVEKQAATRQELTEAERRVERLELQVGELGKRRSALVDASDRAAAEARMREAETAVDRAQLALEKLSVRSPMAGAVYETSIRAGAMLSAGQEIAKVGRIDKVRVRVYVDEPELGRVAVGMPVTMTWDALPERRWKGTVERMPVEITTLGSRQVGEVATVIDNPGGELLPGTNVNVEVQSRVAGNALSIPREALRRNGAENGVFVLEGTRVRWRKVSTGISSVTRIQVLDGLTESDSVALPSDAALADGAEVRVAGR